MSDLQCDDDYDDTSTKYLVMEEEGGHRSGSTRLAALQAKSKTLNALLFIISLILLVSGIICLAISGKIKPTSLPQNSTTSDCCQTTKDEALKVYLAPISGILNVSFASGPGHTFIFTGRVREKGPRWHINFESNDSDIHYHFNPRMNTRSIVRNSYTNSRWSTEETDLCVKPFPFRRGEDFEVITHHWYLVKVQVDESKFATYINGDHYFDFVARLPNLSDVRQIEIAGSVNMTSVTIERTP